MLGLHTIAMLTAFLATVTDIGYCAPKPNIDYKDALEKSLLFFEAQRSGKLPDDNKIKWRGDSHLDDGKDLNVNLTGGWYDDGSGMKYTSSISYSSMLILSALEFVEDGFGEAKELAMREVKWALDYLMRCLIDGKKLVVMVGDQVTERKYWERPENGNWTRPTAWIGDGKTKGGAAHAGEYTSAMAAGSVVFMDSDKEMSQEMLKKAKDGYKLALNNKDIIKKVIPDIEYVYYSGYSNELALAAAWLAYAANKTGDQSSSAMYVKQAEDHIANKCTTCNNGAQFMFEPKGPLIYYILYKTTGDQEYAEKMNLLLQPWKGDTAKHTKDGIVFYYKWGNNRYAVTSSFFAVLAALEGFHATENLNYAKGQADILLGSKGMSYVVGVGKHYPEHVHHRGASCPATSEPCGWSYEKKKSPNPNELIGALAGGAEKEGGTYVDDRTRFKSNEPYLDMNAGLPGLLAGLLKATE